MSVIQRQSWVWAVLPEQARPWTATATRPWPRCCATAATRSAASTPGRPNGASTRCCTTPRSCPTSDDLGRALSPSSAEGGVISIAVAGGRVEPPPRGADGRPGPPAHALADPDRAGPLGARKAERALRERGAGEHAAWPPAIARAAATGSAAAAGCAACARRSASSSRAAAGRGRASLLQTAIDRAQDAAGVELECVSTTVFESGKVVVDLRGPGGEDFFMRLAAGPSRTPARGIGGRREVARRRAGRRPRPARRAARPRERGAPALLARAERDRLATRGG